MRKIDIIREKTVCFTGHRPEKIPNAQNSEQTVLAIKSMLYYEIINSLETGYDTFLVGMQRGIDLWAGEAVLQAAADYSGEYDIKMISVLPYKNFGSNFRGMDMWNFGRIIDRSVHVEVMSQNYVKACYAMRNRFMVDNSSRLIAAAGDMKSGSGQTIRYAKQQGLDIRFIDLNSIGKNTGDQNDQTTLFIL